MIHGSAFQKLGSVIDELDEREMTVLDVVTERNSLASSQRLSVEITVGLDSLSGLSAVEDIDIFPRETNGSDELVTTTFRVEVPVEPEAGADEKVPDGNLISDDVSEKSDTESSSDAPEDIENRDVGSMNRSTSSDDDVPYYRNYDLLARVYEEHDTFAEMTEALDVDVTPATVREHLVNHGIHPTTSKNGTDADSEDDSDVETGEDVQSATIEADGYGLPKSVTMDSLVRAVQSSRTLYEAQTALGLDRETTRTILNDLDLLDLVVRRISSDHSTELDEIIDRIHTASTT